MAKDLESPVELLILQRFCRVGNLLPTRRNDYATTRGHGVPTLQKITTPR